MTETAIALAMRGSGDIRKDGDFLFTIAQQEAPPVRDRSAETGNVVKAAFLPPMEIIAAACLVLQESGFMEEEHLVRAVAQLLGFLRLGPELALVISAAVQPVLQDSGVLEPAQ